MTANGNSHAGGLEERGLDYLNVTGTPKIVRTVVSGSDDSNAHIRNTTGTTALTVTGRRSRLEEQHRSAAQRRGHLDRDGTIERSAFSLNADAGFSMQTDAANTARQTLLFNNNACSGGSRERRPGRPQVSINAGSASTVKASVTNNDIKSAAGAEVILNTLRRSHRRLRREGRGNDIGDAQPRRPRRARRRRHAASGAGRTATARPGWRSATTPCTTGVLRAARLLARTREGDGRHTVTGNTFGPPGPRRSSLRRRLHRRPAARTGDTADVCVDLGNNAGPDRLGPAGAIPDIALDRFGVGAVRLRGRQRRHGRAVLPEPTAEQLGRARC